MFDTKNKQMPKYDSYKDSGVQWLGAIPEHWSTERSQWLFQQRVEKATKQDVQLTASQKYGMISQDEFMILEGRKITQVFLNPEILKHIEANDFVISMRSFQGGIEYSELTGCVSSAYVPLIPSELIHSKYFKYLFKSQRYIEALQSTSNLVRDGQALRFDNFRMVDLPVIPLVEQKIIANFLDKKITQIDEAIAIKQKQIELLKERKQIIIQQAVTQGLNPDAPMKDSGVDWVGQIPKHWTIKQSRFLFRVVRRLERRGDEIKYSVTQARGLVPTDEMIENSTQAKSFDSFQLCHQGDLVLNKYKAHLGVFWKAPDRGIITNNYTVFCPLPSVSSKYFELLFHTPIYVSIFRSLVYGVTEGMSPLYTNDFYSMKSIVPPFDEQLQIESYVTDVDKRYSEAYKTLQDQILSLKEYKTTLINSAVTGKIKVTELA